MVKTGKRSKNAVQRLTLAAMITAAAIIVHTVETLLPPLVPGVPVRLGLANVFTLLALITLGAPYAFAVGVLRCMVSMLITGAVSQLPYSLAGVVLSLLFMLVLEPLIRRGRVSAVGQSVFGAFAFNAGQLAVGVLICGQAMLFYFPVMSLLSIPTGIFTGLTAHYASAVLERSPFAGSLSKRVGHETDKTNDPNDSTKEQDYGN